MKTISIQANALLATVYGNKHAPSVLNQISHALMSRTAKTCGINGNGGLAYIKEVTAHLNSKEGKTTSYASKGLLASIEVLAKRGAEIGKAIFNSESMPCDLVTLQNEVIQAYNDAVTSAKATKQAKAEKVKAEKANDEALTEQALQTQASEFGMVVTDAIDLDDEALLVVGLEAVRFVDLKNAYITMNAQSRLTVSIDAPIAESEQKQA